MSVFSDAVLALTPSGYWRFGEPSGTNANDETNTQDGTYIGTPTLGGDGITTDGDTSVELTGGTMGISVADNAGWDFGTNDFSFMFGLKRSGTWPAAAEFLAGHNGDGGTGSWGLNLQAGNEGRMEVRFESTAYVLRTVTPAASALSDGNFHLCIIAVDRSGNAELWEDGVSQWTVAVSASSAVDLTNTNLMYLGRRNAGNGFIGSLDEFAVWNNVLLTQTEVDALQSALSGAPPQTLRPVADVATTGWTTTPLFSKINESSPDGTVITATAS